MRSKKYFLYLALLSAVILSSCSTLPVQNPVQTSEETSVSSEANIITTNSETESTSSLPVFTDVKEILDFPQDLNEQDLIEYFKKAEALYVVTQGYVSANFYNKNGALYTDPDNKDYLPKQLGVDSITIEQFFELYYNVFTEDFADKILLEEGNKRNDNLWTDYNQNGDYIDSGKIYITRNISKYYNHNSISLFAGDWGFNDLSLVKENIYISNITDNQIIFKKSKFQSTPEIGYKNIHFDNGILIDNATNQPYIVDESKYEYLTTVDYILKLQPDGSWKFDDFKLLYSIQPY